MSRFHLRTVICALAAILLGVAEARAQNATGAITGSVADPNGAVIPAASVTITNKGTGAIRKSATNAEGSFHVENLIPGEYDVRVEHTGFSTQQEIVTVRVGATTTATFALSIGSTTQVIEVAGTGATVNTTDTSLGGIIDRESVENLPLNGRSFLSIAMMEPGVTVSYASNSSAGNPNNFFQVSVGGAPQSMTTISFDGARVNDRTTGGTSQNFSSESVQEFQISTFNFDLSAGTVSAGAINVVSRTGTNQTHGSGFLFFRDHNMAAYPALRRDPYYPDPYFARKQYGFSLGGPIKKDKLFYFGTYERNDQVGARTVTFTDAQISGLNHVARQPMNGHLMATRLDYRVSSAHNAFLRGNIDNNKGLAGAAASDMESSWSSSSNFAYQTAMGLTSVFRTNVVNDLRFSFSYFRNHLAPLTPSECEYAAGSDLYCVGVGGSRISFFGGLTIGNNPNVPQDRHPRNYQLTDNLNWTRGKHRIRFGGSMDYNKDHGSWSRNTTGAFSAYSPTQVNALNPDLYATLPQSLRIGSVMTPQNMKDIFLLPVSGTVTVGIGDPGQPTQYRRDDNNHSNHIRFYIQDSWQPRRGLTLNYGIAWSFETNLIFHTEPRSPFLYPLIGKQTEPVPRDYNNFDPAVGLAWAPGKSRKMVFRTGLSLHHSSLNVTYLRLNDTILNSPAGVGLSQATATNVANPKAGQAGQPATLTFNTPVGFTVRDMVNAMPGVIGALAGTLRFNGSDASIRNIDAVKTIQGPQLNDIFFDKNFATPYTIHFNAGMQREIAPRMVLSADYVMRRGVKFGAFEGEWVDLNRWNRFDPYTLSATGVASVGTRRPVIPACVGVQSTDPKALCSLGPIQYGMPGILSRYQSLQIKLERSFRQGLQFTAGYARARYKSFVSVSNFDNLWDGFGTAALRKNRFTASAIYNIPTYKGASRFAKRILNGYQVSTLMEMASKAPLSATLGSFDVEGDGTFTFRLPGTRPNTFGGGQDAAEIRRLVDDYNARYAAPPNTVLANIGRANRDAIGAAYPYVVLPEKFANSDTYFTHDLRITRTIRTTEKTQLLLIAEGFNVFNISNLTGYSGTLDRVTRPTTAAASPTNPQFNFGQPTARVNPIFGTGGPRAFQLALRLRF